jgi:hypothetical protein
MKKQLFITIATGLTVVSVASKATANPPTVNQTSVLNPSLTNQTPVNPLAKINPPQPQINNQLNSITGDFTNSLNGLTEQITSQAQQGLNSLLQEGLSSVVSSLDGLLGGQLSNVLSFLGLGGNSNSIIQSAQNQAGTTFSTGVNQAIGYLNRGLSSTDAARTSIGELGNTADTNSILATAGGAKLVAQTGESIKPTTAGLTNEGGLIADTGTAVAGSINSVSGLAWQNGLNAANKVGAAKSKALGEARRDSSLARLDDLTEATANVNETMANLGQVEMKNLAVNGQTLEVQSAELKRKIAKDREEATETKNLVRAKTRGFAFLANATAPGYIPPTTTP